MVNISGSDPKDDKKVFFLHETQRGTIIFIHKQVIEKFMVLLPPVAFAIRLRSFLRTRLTPMAPFSTKYLVFRSSIPPVVRITFAPDARIFSTRSFVISASRCLIAKFRILLSTIPWIRVRTLEFFWVVNNNVNTHLHFSFLK